MSKRLALLGLVVSLAACAPVPRPLVMSEVDAVQKSAAAKEARELAPAAYAHADQLDRDAEAKLVEGDLAGAQIDSERAIAAYAHALVLARIARAETQTQEAEAATAKTNDELAKLDAEQARVSAEVTALEARVKVLRDAQAVSPSGPADAAREKARLAAARSLGLEARMLCTAAKMLLPEIPEPTEKSPLPVGAPTRAAVVAELEQAEASVAKLDAELGAAKVVPIDLASRSRAACLSVLTGVRRSMTPVDRAPGASDALLSELSATRAFSPSRDERGVVVTLRDVFAGEKLSAPATEKINALGRTAKEHPRFPIAVVLHQDKEPSDKERAALATRGDLLMSALKAAGASNVNVLVAGAKAPVVDPAGADRARNARVEIVFIAPETF